MAGRGRGRGRVGLNINIEALGLGRGDILTPILAQPPPLYPLLLFKPVSLSSNNELDYMLALKQELKDNFRSSPFFISAPTKVKDIERYSDKYQNALRGCETKRTPDWSRLPHELQGKRKRKKGVPGKLNPNLKAAAHNKDIESLLHKLESDAPDRDAAEDGDAHEEDEDKEKKDKEKVDDEEEDEGEYDDEDLEEETDYNQAYFDNGEDYEEDDDDDEGPTY